MNFITSFHRRGYPKLRPTQKVQFWLGVIGAIGVVITIGFGLFSWWQGRDLTKNIKEIIDAKSKTERTELQNLFPGGFETFGFLQSGSATTGHKENIIKGSTSHNIDITWGSATITELTPDSLTLQLQNLRIMRRETTPGGTQPAGTIQINGAAVWRIDRGTKLVSINNALAFWGYLLGAVVIYDRDGVLVIAMGLQKIEGK